MSDSSKGKSTKPEVVDMIKRNEHGRWSSLVNPRKDLKRGERPTMKRLVTILVVGALAASTVVTVLLLGCARRPVEQTIKIGAILPLSGPAAWLGEMHKWGIDLAVEEINSQGGVDGRRIEVMYEDDQNEPLKAVNAFRKLITIARPPLAITAMSSSGMAVRPLAEENKIILFANGNHPELVKGHEWVFRIFLTNDQEARVMSEAAFEKLGLRRVAVLYIDDASGEGGKEVFEEFYTELGGTITTAEKYDKNGTDFRSEVTKVIATRPEAVYVIGYGNAAGKLLNQLRELGYKGMILGTSNFGGPPLTEIAKQPLEGSVFTTPFYDPRMPTPKVRDFIFKMESRYGNTPQWNTAMEYDGIHIIRQAMTKVKRISGESLRRALMEITQFEGVAGKYEYETREWRPDLTIRTYEQGELKPYEGGR
jgi:branched-chain amino acid transport system substrate-binding protein